MLIKLGIAYDSEEAMTLAEKVMKFIFDEALKEDEALAKERGAFPLWPLSVYRKENPEEIQQ